MDKREIVFGWSRIIGIISAFLITITLLNCAKKESHKELRIPIRIGWQIGWATQGQLTQVLKHTNILEINGLKGIFMGFSYGAPLNEAAISGEVDVTFVADQPAASVIARGGKWKIVCRLIDFRGAIIVPKDSNIYKVEELKGKTLAIPFGSTTHRLVLSMIEDAGLNPKRDLNIINMDILEQAGIVQAGGSKNWGKVDALASWDPNIGIFEDKRLARVIKYKSGLAVVTMSEKFIESHPESAVDFLKSYMEAYYYYSKHSKQANDWFAEEARIEFDPAILDIPASYEPNMRAKSLADITVVLSANYVNFMQEGADFAFEQGLTTVRADMNSATNQELLKKAIEKLRSTNFQMPEIIVKY